MTLVLGVVLALYLVVATKKPSPSSPLLPVDEILHEREVVSMRVQKRVSITREDGRLLLRPLSQAAFKHRLQNSNLKSQPKSYLSQIPPQSL